MIIEIEDLLDILRGSRDELLLSISLTPGDFNSESEKLAYMNGVLDMFCTSYRDITLDKLMKQPQTKDNALSESKGRSPLHREQ